MRLFVAVGLIVPTFAGMAYGILVSLDEIDVERFGLFNMTDECVFVAVGRVDLLVGVYRDKLHFDEYDKTWRGMMCTDVYFRIEDLVKGEPNLGKRYRRFIYEGGTGYSPKHDEVYSMSTSVERGYEVGQRLFLFLTNKSGGSGYRAGWPYDGCYAYFGAYRKVGNQTLEGDDPTVRFTYPRADDTRHSYRIPIEIAVNLAKAYVADKEAAIPLEDLIKAKARMSVKGEYDLPPELLKQLNDKAKEILKAKSKESAD